MATEPIEGTDDAREARAQGASETHAVVAATSAATELKGMFGPAKKSVSIESMNPALGFQSIPTALTEALEEFDPVRHGGEAMAFAPVGREFGSPDFEERKGLSVEIEKASLDNPELPMQLVRDIMVSLEELKSGQVLPYKPG